MSTDDADPSCPECGEPVGMNASYCMHCGAEFDFADGVEDDGSGGGLFGSLTEAIDGTAEDTPDVESSPDAAEVETTTASVEDEQGGDIGTATEASDPASDAPTAETRDSGGTAATGTDAVGTDAVTDALGGGEDGQGLMHPDSTLDNSLTVLVGIGAGIVIGIFSLVVFIPTLGGIGALLGLVTWLGATAYLSRRRTVFDAAEDGGYGLALLLLSLPAVAALEDGGGLGSRAETFVLSLIPAAIVAGIVVAMGYALGTKGVE